jgi:hypothetical protein
MLWLESVLKEDFEQTSIWLADCGIPEQSTVTVFARELLVALK